MTGGYISTFRQGFDFQVDYSFGHEKSIRTGLGGLQAHPCIAQNQANWNRSQNPQTNLIHVRVQEVGLRYDLARVGPVIERMLVI